MLPYEKAMQDVSIIDKFPGETNPQYGCAPENRSYEDLVRYGIVNINKPKGPTSHQVSEYVKKILHVKKAGQSGTLDPGVTGVLPVGTDRGTRVLRVLLKAGKEYVCLMHVHDDFGEEHIRKVMHKFVGEIKQLPPIKSAVKRQIRTRKVYYIDIIEISGREVLFKVGCQAGTYIRKLCDDIGKALGGGAHMAQLVRTKVGMFTLGTSVTMQDFSDAIAKKDVSDDYKQYLLPIESAVAHIPKIWVHDSAIDALCNGSYLAVPGIAKFESTVSDSWVAVLSLKGELIGLGSALMSAKKITSAEKGFAVKMDTIIMEIGTYPNWRSNVQKS
ncbi:MAG: RNA-guided pseudouridylation complex pseudouridine synthase subunit Cbf5 [Candidatus Woesearchaeota archaeon]